MAKSVYSQVGYELKRAQHALRLAMDAGLRPLGVSTPQYAILANLRETPGASGANLARASFVSPQTMNDLLIGLERSGLVSRLPSDSHGRIIETHMTRAGLRQLERADKVVAAIERRMTGSMTAAERQTLFKLLSRCADELSGARGKPPHRVHVQLERRNLARPRR